MADITDAMNAEKLAREPLNLLDEEKSLDYNLVTGIIAVTNAILAVGVRLDYVIRDVSKQLYNSSLAGR